MYASLHDSYLPLRPNLAVRAEELSFISALSLRYCWLLYFHRPNWLNPPLFADAGFINIVLMLTVLTRTISRPMVFPNRAVCCRIDLRGGGSAPTYSYLSATIPHGTLATFFRDRWGF